MYVESMGRGTAFVEFGIAGKGKHPKVRTKSQIATTNTNTKNRSLLFMISPKKNVKCSIHRSSHPSVDFKRAEKVCMCVCVCLKKNQNAPRPSEHPPVVVVVGSHIQRIVLATEDTTVTQQFSHRPIKCQSRLWSQRGTKVNGSHHGDNPLLRPTRIQIATKSYAALQAMAPANIKTVHQTSLLHIEINELHITA